jgi:hypothetical protein
VKTLNVFSPKLEPEKSNLLNKLFGSPKTPDWPSPNSKISNPTNFNHDEHVEIDFITGEMKYLGLKEGFESKLKSFQRQGNNSKPSEEMSRSFRKPNPTKEDSTKRLSKSNSFTIQPNSSKLTEPQNDSAKDKKSVGYSQRRVTLIKSKFE